MRRAVVIAVAATAVIFFLIYFRFIPVNQKLFEDFFSLFISGTEIGSEINK